MANTKNKSKITKTTIQKQISKHKSKNTSKEMWTIKKIKKQKEFPSNRP